jgi:hypothetical protein
VAAAAHAALQALFAIVSIAPVSIAAVITVMKSSSKTGFLSRDGSFFERLKMVVEGVARMLFSPVVLSGRVAFHMGPIGEEALIEMVAMPPLYFGLLFSLTLPSLPTMFSEELSGGLLIDAVNRRFGQFDIAKDKKTWLAEWFNKYHLTGIERDPHGKVLECLDEAAFRWRVLLPFALLDGIEDFDDYYRSLMGSPALYVVAVAKAVCWASCPDDQECVSDDGVAFPVY